VTGAEERSGGDPEHLLVEDPFEERVRDLLVELAHLAGCCVCGGSLRSDSLARSKRWFDWEFGKASRESRGGAKLPWLATSGV